ncbi:MAG TPA: DUF5947 family protein [Pirellulales bacterium]|jgi:hypothetical protein|nr:DUF5947 family protein [Pirellulales bacterium]
MIDPQSKAGNTAAELPSPLAALRRFARPRASGEACELCGLALAPEHQHLLEVKGRQLRCCCDACAVLFPGHEGARFLRVPRRTVALDGFALSDELWAGLRLPIDLAFIYHTGTPQRVAAVYPSPAGGTESLVEDESWQEVVRANPMLAGLEPEVETLLVNRVGSRREYYRAPIDVCFHLVGVVRTSWRGLSGGAKVWSEIERFFTDLRARAAPAPLYRANQARRAPSQGEPGGAADA